MSIFAELRLFVFFAEMSIHDNGVNKFDNTIWCDYDYVFNHIDYP